MSRATLEANGHRETFGQVETQGLNCTDKQLEAERVS